MQSRIPTQPIEISAMEARKQLGQLMNRAYYGGERFVVKRDELPMIKIESIYNETEKEIVRGRFFAFVQMLREELAAQDQQDVDEAFEDAIREARKQP